jgi:magnesium chelatase family protein
VLGIINSCCCLGMQTHYVRVEIDVSPGLPAFTIVGLPDPAVRESTERVRGAIRNAGYNFPLKRITVNLAPADLRKEGSLFDLPIAVGILVATEQLPVEKIFPYLLVGELSLDGTICAVPGILLMVADTSKENAETAFIVPLGNLEEASLISGPTIYGAAHLCEVVSFIKSEGQLTTTSDRVAQKARLLDVPGQDQQLDFADVKGQVAVKRALEISAVGGHNILLIGPPGTGKTLLARRLPSIMPPLTWNECLETTKIYSVAGLLPKDCPVVARRPFRAPHHTSSAVSIIGGGRVPHPGEISLATNGILFMDELPEFNRDVLEALRQPLEERTVTVARSAGICTYPAGFTFIGAMNPCQCGFWGDTKKECTCTPHQVQKYRNRISGPILDRIDLQVEVPRLDVQEMANTLPGESSETILMRVLEAYQVQQKRYRNDGIKCNTELSGRLLKKYCHLGKPAQELILSLFHKLNLSMRAFDRVLKVARTIADLAGAEVIEPMHLAEAVQYRCFDQPM